MIVLDLASCVFACVSQDMRKASQACRAGRRMFCRQIADQWRSVCPSAGAGVTDQAFWFWMVQGFWLY